MTLLLGGRVKHGKINTRSFSCLTMSAFRFPIFVLRLQQKPWWPVLFETQGNGTHSFHRLIKMSRKSPFLCLVSAYSIKHVKNVYLLCFILHIAKNTMLKQNNKKYFFHVTCLGILVVICSQNDAINEVNHFFMFIFHWFLCNQRSEK